jgi:hypothetical protein
MKILFTSSLPNLTFYYLPLSNLNLQTLLLEFLTSLVIETCLSLEKKVNF